VLRRRGILDRARGRREAAQERAPGPRHLSLEQRGAVGQDDGREEDEVRDALGHGLGDLGDHEPAHRVPDDDRAVEARLAHRAGDCARVRTDGGAAPLVGPAAVAGEVHGERAVARALEARLDELPAPRAVAHAVDEDELLWHLVITSEASAPRAVTIT
jgi:hypothetical protein